MLTGMPFRLSVYPDPHPTSQTTVAPEVVTCHPAPCRNQSACRDQEMI